MLEVECKIPLRDPVALEAALEAAGAVPKGMVSQIDTYYLHPCRDLVETDEALRLRDEDGNLELTYKGARQDAEAKVREEITMAVDGACEVVLARLGFAVGPMVTKMRTRFELPGCEVGVDDVEGLGLFVEVEQHDGDLDALHATVRSLGLDPADSESRSYLELLAST